MKKIYFMLAGCLCALCVQAQSLQRIDKPHNHIRPGDIIIKQQVEFKDPGAAGKDILWDFSHLNAIDEKYKVIYYCKTKSDTLNITGKEHDTFYRYKFNSDTLWLSGYDNRTTKMIYEKPEALLHFPLHYGDTLFSSFIGKGIYCHKISLTSKGYTKVSVDACGKIITPENDTLKVIRVFRLKEFTDVGVDNVHMRMLTYQWFTQGNRYPVFETVKTFKIFNDSVQPDYFTSFYFSAIERDKLVQDKIIDFKNNIEKEDLLINCTIFPNPIKNSMLIEYKLSVDAKVSFQLCDISGRPWISIPEKNINSGNQQQIIQTSGLPVGSYALYITVNNNMYRRAVIKAGY